MLAAAATRARVASAHPHARTRPAHSHPPAYRLRARAPPAQELELLEDDASVFKLIGPVLIKQELMEVKNNVTKRVEFIRNDVKRLEGNVKKFEQQAQTVQGNIAALQKGAAK